MRVLSLVANPCIADGRVIKAAEAFAQAGHQVTVLALRAPGAPEDETRAGVRYLRLAYDRDGFFPMNLLGRLLPAGSFLYRGLRMVIYNLLKYQWFERQASGIAIEARPDVIHAHDLETLPAALSIAGSTGARVMYDAHELETHRNPRPMALIRWRIRSVMRRSVPRADHVITVGQGIAEILRRRYGLPRVGTVYNVPRIRPCARSVRSDIGLSAASALAVYTGKVTSGRGLEQVLTGLTFAPGVHLAIVGPCDQAWAARLDRWVAQRGLADRVHRLPPVHFDEVVSYIRDADVGLLSVEPLVESYRLSMPNKLFELAFAGLRILSNRLPEAERLIAQYELGIVIDQSDPQAWAAALQSLLASARSSIRRELPDAFVERWGWDNQVRSLIEALSITAGTEDQRAPHALVQRS